MIVKSKVFVNKNTKDFISRTSTRIFYSLYRMNEIRINRTVSVVVIKYKVWIGINVFTP